MRFLSDILAKAGLVVDGTTKLVTLAGSGTRMVVADAIGVLSTQAIPTGGGTTTRFNQTFTATAAQTAFTVSSTLTTGYFDVYLNGVKLNSSSYSNTTSVITLVDGAAAGDIIDVVNFTTVTISTLLPDQTGNSGKYLTTNGTTLSWATIAASGTVTSVSVVSANGFAGTVATSTATPAITISTTITGILKGNGTSISAAIAGTDYQVGSTNLTSLAALSFASTSFVKMTATGTFSLDTNVYYLSSNPSGYTNNTGTVTSVAAITLGTTGTDLSSSVATGTTTPVITLNVPTASAANRGALSATDWSTFNGKQAALNGTGFVKISGTTISYDNSAYYLASNPTGYTTNTGTVTTVSITTANGVSGTVATAGTTPAITLTLGAITPSSVNSVVISGSTTPTLAVTGTSSISGSNTGDNATNSLYSGLVTNATHTGDATGATALTVVGLRGVALPTLGATAGLLKYTGTGTNTWVFDSSVYLTANQSITLSGDISGTGSTAITTAIGANKVTNAMLAQVATATFKGRTTAATGNVEDLTVTQATAMLNIFSSTLKGLAPASGGGTTNFLRADGTWAAPAAGGSAYSVISVSTTHNETATSGTKIIKADTTGAGFSINLPTAVGNTATLIIKKVAGAIALIIDGNTTETVDGSLSIELFEVNESVTLISDNTNWQIV